MTDPKEYYMLECLTCPFPSFCVEFPDSKEKGFVVLGRREPTKEEEFVSIYEPDTFSPKRAKVKEVIEIKCKMCHQADSDPELRKKLDEAMERHKETLEKAGDKE